MQDIQRLSGELFPLLEPYKRLMVIGPTDTGKSTFIKNYALYLISRGETPYVVDLDVGQSDIGPVGTIGSVKATKTFTLLEELPVHDLEFFGFSAPSHDIISYMHCVHRLSQKLPEGKKVLIDTTGWIHGYEAFSLKLSKANILDVDAVLLIGEVVHRWERAFSGVGIRVFKCLPSKLVVPKDKSRRKLNRYAATLRFFEKCPLAKLDIKRFPAWARELKDPKHRILGLYTKKFELTAVAWVLDVQEGMLIIRVHKLGQETPTFVRVGQKISL